MMLRKAEKASVALTQSTGAFGGAVHLCYQTQMGRGARRPLVRIVNTATVLPTDCHVVERQRNHTL